MSQRLFIQKPVANWLQYAWSYSYNYNYIAWAAGKPDAILQPLGNHHRSFALSTVSVLINGSSIDQSVILDAGYNIVDNWGPDFVVPLLHMI